MRTVSSHPGNFQLRVIHPGRFQRVRLAGLVGLAGCALVLGYIPASADAPPEGAAVPAPSEAGPQSEAHVTLTFSKEDTRAALKRLFALAALQFSIEPGLEGVVTVSLKDVRFGIALRAILASNSTGPLTYTVKGGTYRITRKDSSPVLPLFRTVDYGTLATSTLNDLLKHYWVGDAATGHIVNTNESGFGGHDFPQLAKPGVLWERATFAAVLANYYQATKDPDVRRRILADWAYVRDNFSAASLSAVGKGTRNWALDDACWSGTMYWNIYRATGDAEALKYAQQVFVNAYDRWADGKPAQGLWYDDARNRKASVQAVLLLLGIRLYEATRDKQYLDRVMAPYGWMEKTLLRDDGLYWCEYDANGPRRIGPIAEGASDTFLGANMAQAVLQARLYRDLGDAAYKRRALQVADAILTHEHDAQGHLLNDRDAWADAYLAGEWVREITTLPGANQEYAAIVRRTASAIYDHARTPEGYYGPCWNGPLTGAGCPWLRPGRNVATRPEQIMTSSTGANIIMAAALLDANGP